MLLDTRVREGESKEQYRVRMAAEMKAFPERQKKAMRDGRIRVVMDVDDFGFLLPGYDDLLKLKKSLPGLRITCFTIPLPKQFFHPENAKHFTWEKYRRWAEFVNEQDWIEIAFHGFSHTHNECAVGYRDALMIIDATENLFNRVGLTFSRIFKAPYWQYSYDFLMALKDRGYVCAIDRDHMRPTPEGLETYVFNWSFQEAPPDAEIIKGHGHFEGNNTNNIIDTLGNILKVLPPETKFMTVGEYVEEEKDRAKAYEESAVRSAEASGAQDGGAAGIY